ncbi:hypothetical protein I302_107918 [Kwoniella bestiolae CBS 10118]|uniref:Major facilitator superfamily (MFS) profile domain-containing protein n=1 Tax=Kwoniella bestiolae CBS 10118 TaxID=1296100 RepID=A0A1B9FX70_9TREE|nr:hypothetical protein I302_06342 [Kwoniella bestiolae CBS 10118]OCF23361.1 hypothetical protein I302_06342 [Kwoniella bestiolae CBS 10118]
MSHGVTTANIATGVAPEDGIKQPFAETNVIETQIEYDDSEEIDEQYLSKPKYIRFYRGVLCQMLLFGAVSFVGPALADAMSNLGGNGLSDPNLANLAQALNYAGTCLMTFFGGPLVNKLGVRWACLINAVCFPLTGSASYVVAKGGPGWYLVFAKVVTGLTNGFVYVSEGAAMLTYPRLHERGKYLSIWSGMRNSGSILGGIVALVTNYKTAGAGGVAWSTYIVFMTLESTGWIWALLLSPSEKVRRNDGTRVPISRKITWAEEMRALIKHFGNKRLWLIAAPAFYSFFFLAPFGTYLAVHFSVRARALSSFLAPTTAVITTLMYGRFLDLKSLSPKKKAWYGAAIWLAPNIAALVWVNVKQWSLPKSTAYDYTVDSGLWSRAYFCYLVMFASGYWCQIYLYWTLSTFSTDLKASTRTGGLFRACECAGQTVSFAIGSDKSRLSILLALNAALVVPAVISLIGLISIIPDAPSATDDIADAQPTEAVDSKT